MLVHLCLAADSLQHFHLHKLSMNRSTFGGDAARGAHAFLPQTGAESFQLENIDALLSHVR